VLRKAEDLTVAYCELVYALSLLLCGGGVQCCMVMCVWVCYGAGMVRCLVCECVLFINELIILYIIVDELIY